MSIDTKPQGWGRRSIAPYYNKKTADEIRPYVDRMIESGQDQVFKYSECCGPNEKIMSKQTLYNKINQSVRFLVERDDTPDKLYSRWKEQIRCSRKAGFGVIIYFIPGFTGEPILTAETVIPSREMPKWKQRLDEWIESNNMKPFIQDRLILSDEEITNLKAELDGLSSVEYSITNTCVKVLKVKE